MTTNPMNKRLMILALLAMLVVAATFFPIVPPPPESACDNGWSVWWVLETNAHCDGTGTYVLWHCHDYTNHENYFCDQCWYSAFLPIVQK